MFICLADSGYKKVEGGKMSTFLYMSFLVSEFPCIRGHQKMLYSNIFLITKV